MKELSEFLKTPVLLGAAAMTLGLLIRFNIGRRRFHRRTFTGIQLFSTYSRCIIITTLESIAAWIGSLLFWVGILLVLLNWFIY